MLTTFATTWLLGLNPLLAAPPLTTAEFGHVFSETEPVVVQVVAPDLQQVKLVDYDGQPAATKATETVGGVRQVDFGKLPPGYYEAVAGDAKLPLVVVIDPAKRVPGESRLASDNAMSWLVKPEYFAGVAELLHKCGIGYVRERLSWGQVEAQQGTYEWGKYDQAADALHAAGIGIYQVFHSSPGWSRADQDWKAAPDDLRVIYGWAKTLAEHWRGKVSTYEVWNEPDISFFSHPASECAAFQKAAFLGFKAVDPDLTVLGPSIAHGVSIFSEGLADNGLGSYLDAWNYHIYADPSAYAKRRLQWQEFLDRRGITAPLWCTEAGDRVDGPEGILTDASRRHQAAFISRAFPSAVSEGVDRHFWFIFPFYRERSTGWGLFEPDERAPFPGVAAMSNVTYCLGAGTPLGRLDLGEAVEAPAFGRGDGSVGLAVWSTATDTPEVTLPIDWATVKDARNHLGTPLVRGAGLVKVQPAPTAVFFILDRLTLAAPPAPPALAATAKPGLFEVVPRLRVDVPVKKDADAYVVQADSDLDVQLEVYNFGAAALRGQAKLTGEPGWVFTPATPQVSVAAGERVVVPLKLHVPGAIGSHSVGVTIQHNGQSSSSAQLRLQTDPAKLAAIKELPLTLADPAVWRKNIAGHGTMQVEAEGDDGIRFEFKFSRDSDNWAYPEQIFKQPVDLSSYDALRFEYRTSTVDAGPIRLMLIEDQGISYFTQTGLLGTTAWQAATVQFNEFGPLMGTDPNGHLDLERIKGLRLGANSKPLELTLEFRNLRAVQLQAR